MTTMSASYQRTRRAKIKADASLAAAPKSYAMRDMPGILPFQREWLAKAFATDIDLAALSAARGSGKSTLAGWVAACAVAPQGALHAPSGAVLIVAPTTSQGREVLLAARGFLEGVDDLRWRDSASGVGVRHLPTASECRVMAASSKSLLGYGAHASVIVFDEVAAAGAAGRAVFDALITGLGKRAGQRLIALGTRSPSGPMDWWPKWLSSTAGQPRTHIDVLEGDPENWRDPGEAVKANPLAAGEPLASVLGRERAEAESDPSALARYRSYRLNHASDPVAARVFSASELMTVCGRPAPPRRGRTDFEFRLWWPAQLELGLRDMARVGQDRIMGNRRAGFERDAHGGRRALYGAVRSAAGRRHSLARGRLPRAAVPRCRRPTPIY